MHLINKDVDLRPGSNGYYNFNEESDTSTKSCQKKTREILRVPCFFFLDNMLKFTVCYRK